MFWLISRELLQRVVPAGHETVFCFSAGGRRMDGHVLPVVLAVALSVCLGLAARPPVRAPVRTQEQSTATDEHDHREAQEHIMFTSRAGK